MKTITDFKNGLTYKIQRSEQLLAEYTGDNTRMKLCVRSFDEKLCLKANKHQVEELRGEVEKEYMNK